MPDKIRRPGPGGRKADFIDDGPYEEELDGGPLSKRKPSDTSGSSRNRVESRSGPSRLSGAVPETKVTRSDPDSISQSDRQLKKPRPFGDRPRRTPSPRKRPRPSQDSSDLSDPSSPEAPRKQSKRMHRNQDGDVTPRAQSPSRKVSSKPSERNVSSLSQRSKERDVSSTSQRTIERNVSSMSQRPIERNVSSHSQRPSDRFASGASGSSQPLMGSQGISKRRKVIASSDEEDQEPSQQREVSKTAEVDEGDRSRDRTRDERVEKPRPRLQLSPDRPRPKQRKAAGDEGDISRRREEAVEDDGRARKKEIGADEDRVQASKRKQVEINHVDAEVKTDAPRNSKDVKDSPYGDGNEKRAGDRKVSRDELERVKPIKTKRPLDADQANSADKARDVDLERPKKKKHNVDEESLSAGALKGREPFDVEFSDDEPVRRKDLKPSVVAQRAVESSSSKRPKADMPGQEHKSGGDATPVARKGARQFGPGSSGRNTPVAKKPAKDMVMDLLTASMSGASSAYASALGMVSLKVGLWSQPRAADGPGCIRV